MSGHITRMSRGSRVGSSWSRPTSTSRSTSTWRAAPWQACTCTDRSPAVRRRAQVGVGGGVGAQVVLEPAEQRVGQGRGRTDSSREPRRARGAARGSRGRARRAAGVRRGRPTCRRSRGTGPSAAVGARSRHSSVDACGSQRCTSRRSPRARSSATSVTGSRVWPKRDNRGGRSRSSPPDRRRSTVSACRTSGGVVPTWTRSRRHSSACQRRSGSSGPPAPSVSRPSRQSVTSAGRCTAYDANSPASRRATA